MHGEAFGQVGGDVERQLRLDLVLTARQLGGDPLLGLLAETSDSMA